MDKFDYLRFYETLSLFNSVEPIINYRLAKSAKRQAQLNIVEIYAYSLLPNHFHLLLKEVNDGGISEFMKRISSGYTTYFNERYKRSGSLFQGKFKRVHVDSQEQYNHLFAYINENHTVHNINLKKELFHSSSVHYQGIATSKAIAGDAPNEPYLSSEYKSLAQDIYSKRNEQEAIYLFE